MAIGGWYSSIAIRLNVVMRKPRVRSSAIFSGASEFTVREEELFQDRQWLKCWSALQIGILDFYVDCKQT